MKPPLKETDLLPLKILYMWKTLLSMGSFDVDSLFNNIPLVETINNCVNQLFENTDSVEGFVKSELKELLCLSTKVS